MIVGHDNLDSIYILGEIPVVWIRSGKTGQEDQTTIGSMVEVLLYRIPH